MSKIAFLQEILDLVCNLKLNFFKCILMFLPWLPNFDITVVLQAIFFSDRK